MNSTLFLFAIILGSTPQQLPTTSQTTPSQLPDINQFQRFCQKPTLESADLAMVSRFYQDWIQDYNRTASNFQRYYHISTFGDAFLKLDDPKTTLLGHQINYVVDYDTPFQFTLSHKDFTKAFDEAPPAQRKQWVDLLIQSKTISNTFSSPSGTHGMSEYDKNKNLDLQLSNAIDLNHMFRNMSGMTGKVQVTLVAYTSNRDPCLKHSLYIVELKVQFLREFYSETEYEYEDIKSGDVLTKDFIDARYLFWIDNYPIAKPDKDKVTRKHNRIWTKVNRKKTTRVVFSFTCQH